MIKFLMLVASLFHYTFAQNLHDNVQNLHDNVHY